MTITLVSVKGAPLSIPEFDGNFEDLDGRVQYFETGTGSIGQSVVNVTAAGSTITFHYSDSSAFTVTIPPTLLVFRGDWLPGTVYTAMDIVVGPQGTVYSRNRYLVLFGHTSAGIFDPAGSTAGNDEYALLMPSELARSQQITTATFDPVLIDAQSYNRCTNVAGCVVTIPDDSTVDFPIDTEMSFRQCDISGAVSFIGESSAVNNGLGFPDDSNPNTAVRGAVVQLKKIGANEWDLYGRLELASAQMLLGALSYQPPVPPLPDIPYTTFGVHFNGSTYLHRGAALTGWGTPSQFTAALWTKLSAANDGIFSDANFFVQGAVITGGNHYISMDVASDDTYFDAFGNATLTSAAWQGIFISGDLNANPSSLRIYRNDSDVLNSGDTAVGGDTTIVAGLEFFFGQDGFGTKITGDVADFRLWLGAYADFSNTNTRRRFIRSNGKPADKTLATALLGTPKVSFISTGNTASFIANGGSGGTFTAVGTLSMAGTSPTD